MPPSSSGLGRSPFKATTGVRIPVGAQLQDTHLVCLFFIPLHSVEYLNHKRERPRLTAPFTGHPLGGKDILDVFDGERHS